MTAAGVGVAADSAGTRGKFIVIWKRNDRGDWRIHADAFSSVD